MTTLALIGNPNCGKTTLFNALTGARQQVGNWPGVTVERKVGRYHHGGGTLQVIDLPGTYGLDEGSGGLDEAIARNYLAGRTPDTERADVIVNVIDASSLARGLFLTTALRETGLPLVVALNMIDVADRNGMHIDTYRLGQLLGCPVVPIIASRADGLTALKDAIESVAQTSHARASAGTTMTGPPVARPPAAEAEARYQQIDAWLAECLRETPVRRTLTDRIDAVVLNRWLAFPTFLVVMYLTFLFSINVGSAFIDLFDGVGLVLFVEGPRQLMTQIGLPAWLITILADGVGGGLQLVGTFIPVIGTLFLALALLEDSGYMGRIAFIVDRLLRSLGLPGKSFVPLIVGFGCNVPAVMATRTLDSRPDRILTTLMAPYMSCGARLTVYALFAAAFFPVNGQNIVFALYLIGIGVAVMTAYLVRKHLLQSPAGAFVLELPEYHLPTLKGLLLQTWQRLQGFVVRAGKAIVMVVVVLNTLNSIGTDGTFGNQNSEKSVLSQIGRALTPAFAPLGVTEDNWPATVGIFTGFFAKEVVVGTLDALYTPVSASGTVDLSDTLTAAARSVPDNLRAVADQIGDPLGLDLGDLSDEAAVAEQQAIARSTLDALRNGFPSALAAFSYLLFVLLYMPCVATIGVIFKEQGAFWAAFSAGWSFTVAYAASVTVYQVGQLGNQPVAALGWIAVVLSAAALLLALMVKQGRQREVRLIPVRTLE
ncbi:MAG: ferrous iron transport protein B [Pseudomonadales bacterium]